MLNIECMKTSAKLRQLEYSFPQLTEANQDYVLGIAEGLKHAQHSREEQYKVPQPGIKLRIHPPGKKRGIT